MAIMKATNEFGAGKATRRSPARRTRTPPLSIAEQSALLCTVFAHSPDGMAFIDTDLVIRAANEGFAGQVRVPVTSMVGRKARDVLPGWSERAEQAYRQVRETGQPFHTESFSFVFTNQPERVTYWDVSISPVYAAGGGLLGYLILSREVTDRKLVEKEYGHLRQELQEMAGDAQERAVEMAAIIDSIADGVLVCDRDGRIVEINQAGLRIMGFSAKEEGLRSAEDFLKPLDLRHPDGRPLAPEEMAIKRALKGEVVHGFEETARDIRGRREIHLLVSAAPLRNRDGKITGAVAVVSDITRIRELDRLKDQFLTVAAHELKTPIAIMKGYAQGLLRTSGSVAPSQRKMLEAINRGSDRIDNIVEDLLDISRLHTGRLELNPSRVDLAELVTEVVDRLDLTAAEHRVRVVKAEHAMISADRYRLDQVLTNLIDNAMRYSPQGGSIDVQVSIADGDALVSIRDYGIGIPSGKQQNIFERFYRAHTGTPFDYGGMGVSLYICKEIISRHGGKIWFESEEGKGSTFHFSLPLQV